MTSLLALPVAVPILGAALATVLRRPSVQRTITFSTVAVVFVYAGSLVSATSGGRVIATQIGGWPRPFGITFVADPLAALMLWVSTLLIIVCTAFAVARREDERPVFHPLVCVLTAGVGGSLLTADLFNLFVFFEVMLIASYVLLVLGGSREQVRGGAVYVTTNMLASTLLIAGVALVYGETGTVNMAQLSETIRATGTIAAAAALLLVAFSVKASLVPVHGWLPRSYTVASPAVAALFSGLLTKVGVYAIYRLYAIVFSGDVRFRTLLMVLAAITMVVGVLGAVGRDSMRDILAFHMVSQVGYILMGLALFGPLGLAAGVFYLLQYVIVKTSLFLSAGAVETFRGTGHLAHLSALARSHPVLAAAFMVSALSLAGIPPLSGFFAKVLLIRAAFVGADHWIAAVAVAVSFFTLMSMIKIWNGVFWGDPATGSPMAPTGDEPRVPAGQIAGGAVDVRGDIEGVHERAASLVAPAVVLAVLTVVLGFGAAWLLGLADGAAAALVDPTAYVRAVLEGR